MSDGARLTNALLLSLVLHAFALGLIGLARQAKPSRPLLPALLDVDVVSLPPSAAAPAAPAPPPSASEPAPEPPAPVLPEAQIVSPPEAGKSEPPKQTRFLSDRNVAVERQTVKRGESGSEAPLSLPEPSADTPVSRRGAASHAAEPIAAGVRSASPQVGTAPGLEQLLPRAGQLVREGYGAATAEREKAPGAEADRATRHDMLKYADARPAGLGALGTRGSLDFLPDVREGDITLLNTKAEQFAPFVRRVAQRVFQTQVISLRRELSHAAVSARESASVEALMDRRGNFLSLRITDRSRTGSSGIDRHLQRACHQAFFDLNPPPGAEAADGNIHFLFRTQIEVLVAPNGVTSYGALLTAGLL